MFAASLKRAAASWGGRLKPTYAPGRPPSPSLLPSQLFLGKHCASDFAYADFASTAGLRLAGVANRTGDRLRLTSALPGVAGASWHSVKQAREGPGSAKFGVWLHTGQKCIMFGGMRRA